MASNALYNQDAESGFLAGLLRHPDSFSIINETGVMASDFLGSETKKVAKALFFVESQYYTPDLVHIIERLRAGGNEDSVELVNELSMQGISEAQATDYGKVVKRLSVNRQIGNLGASIITVAQENREDPEAAIIEVQTMVNKLFLSLPEPAASPRPIEILKEVHAIQSESVIPIHWSHSLQDATGGLREKEYWVLGGYSSVGKSTIAVNMAVDTLRQNKKVMMVSLEMSRAAYMIRMLALVSKVPSRSIRDNVTIGLDAHKALKQAEDIVTGWPLLIYENLYTMDMIANEARKVKARDGLDVLFVDFHQNVHVTGDEVKDAREVALRLQRLAKELEICVIDFSQLSNAYAQQDQEERGMGSIYSFKGSGAIKDAADVNLMLRRDQRNMQPAIRLQIAKNRSGPLVDNIVCDFNLETGEIREPEDVWA